jgi:hypothetical protein
MPNSPGNNSQQNSHLERMLMGLTTSPLQQQISHLERLLTGLTTRLFDNKNSDYNTKNPYKLFYADKVIVILSLRWSDPFLHTRMNENHPQNEFSPKIH